MISYDYDNALRGLLQDIGAVERAAEGGDGPTTEVRVGKALLRIYDILWALTRRS